MYGGGAASAAIFRDYLLEGALYVLIFLYFPLLNWPHLCSFSTCLTELTLPCFWQDRLLKNFAQPSSEQVLKSKLLLKWQQLFAF